MLKRRNILSDKSQSYFLGFSCKYVKSDFGAHLGMVLLRRQGACVNTSAPRIPVHRRCRVSPKHFVLNRHPQDPSFGLRNTRLSCRNTRTSLQYCKKAENPRRVGDWQNFVKHTCTARSHSWSQTLPYLLFLSCCCRAVLCSAFALIARCPELWTGRRSEIEPPPF